MESQIRQQELDSTVSSELDQAGPAFLARFHRHMHGRYLAGIAVGLMAALVGAYGGFRSSSLSYRSTGVLRITPLTLKILYAQADVATSVFEGFIDVQINSMRSRPMVTAVLNSESWRQAHAEQPPMDPETFLRNLEITHQPRSELIEISFTDSTPFGAQTGVRLLIETYMRLNGDQSINQRIQATQERSNQLSEELAAYNKRIGEITQKYGTDDLKQLHQAKVLELSRLETMIMDTEINLVLSESAMGKGETAKEMPASEIASSDEIMRKLLEEAQRGEVNLAEALLTRGKDHPDVVAIRTKNETVKQEIKARAEAFQKFHRSSFVNNVGVLEGMPTPASIDALRQRRDKLRALYNVALQKSLDIGSKGQEIAGLLEESRKTRERLADNQAKVEQLRVDASIVGQIMVVSTGDIPRDPVKDRRRMLAGAAAVGGLLLGFGMIAAWSFTDHRLRRAGDLAGAGFAVPVLGTFPKVSPERAALAGAALHEAITALQIDPDLSAIRVFAISSTVAGEGKSEMAAALALGFAALGKRTLLVDFDHRTGHLTRALTDTSSNFEPGKTVTGICDVLAGEKLASCTSRTRLGQVSFLPMAGKDPGCIGSLTSAQLRFFLAQAAAEFQIVLVDVPPILEGLEATLICKEAESSLLTATPNTSDVNLQGAFARLRTAGAAVGGILFNRAKSSDMGSALLVSSQEVQPFQPSPNGSFVDALKAH